MTSPTTTPPKHLAVVVAVVVAAALASCTPKAPGKLTFGVDAKEHDAYFDIGAGAHHALDKTTLADGVISCDSCHAAGTQSFTEFRCTSCHEHAQDVTDAIHVGLSGGGNGYRYADASCLSCHARGNADVAIDDATHTRDYFPIDDASAHEAVQCSGCHTSSADRSIVSCTGCHDHAADGQEIHAAAEMQAVHGQMTGYAWDTASCLSCHAKSQVPGTYDHVAFPIAAADVHAPFTCKDCHATPQDRTQLACITCHTGDHEEQKTASEHSGVADYRFDSGSCYACHAQSQVPGVFDHAAFFPIESGSTHALGSVVAGETAAVACTSCHKDPTNNSLVDCTGCHHHDEPTLAPVHTGIADYTWQTTGCLFCHPHGEPDGYLAEHPQFPIAATDIHAAIGSGAAAGFSCTQCHASTTDRSQLLCTTCHLLNDMEPVHRSMPGYNYDSTACYTCHAQSQVPGVFDHEPFFPLVGTVHAVNAAGSANGALSCADCHSDRTNRSVLNCTACHFGTHDQAPMATAHNGVPNYSWTPASCVGCHPRGTVDGATFSHPFFPITATDTHGQNGIACVDCHTTPGDNTKVDCTACHLGTHDQAPMTATHANVPGFAWSTTQCLFCHPHSEPVGNIDHAAFFPITTGTAHAGIACADCHIDPNNRQTLGCAQCHASDNPSVATVHNGVPGFANTSPACLTCHPHAEPVGTMDHTAFFPIGTGSKHASAAFVATIGTGQNQCTACHASRTDRTQENCSSCHTASVPPALSTSHSRVNGFANASVNCKQCHGDSQVDTVASHTVFNPRHHGAKCIDCHRTFRADKPFAVNFAAGVCTRCHSASCTITNQNSCGG